MRAAVNAELFASGAGRYAPGPSPFTPISVEATGQTTRLVVACAVEEGWFRTAPGGPPATPDKVEALDAEMVLLDGTWRVDGLYIIDSPPDCSTTPIERRPLP